MPDEQNIPIEDAPDSSLDAQREVRLAKRRALEDAGWIAHPERYERTHSAAQAKTLADDTANVSIAGRVMAFRDMGKLTFAQLQDRSGRIQFALKADELGRDAYKFLLKNLDLGDFLGLTGEMFTTKTGEKTLLAKDVVFLGKALLPLPEKWHGLTDKETRYRKRYLDLLVNEETRRVFDVRTKLVRAIRTFLDAAHFEEVETPILQYTAGGAMAKPFMTHHNALDLDVALRIAPETYLKRLIVGGYERVYEFARCFRNEGMDPSHLQEFTMLEYYAAYWNFEDNMKFTEDLVTHALTDALGTTKITHQGVAIDFAAPWPRREFTGIIEEETGIDVKQLKTMDDFHAATQAKNIRLELEEGVSLPNAIDTLYKKAVRPKLVQPQFLIRHPADLKPLARRNDKDPQLADSFQLLVNGWEVVNAYSELVDPLEQRRAFEIQAAAREAGDEEAMAAEEDYLEAMEHGMPPISGWGMGVDRFVALLTDQESLRDTVFFPLMRPE